MNWKPFARLCGVCGLSLAVLVGEEREHLHVDAYTPGPASAVNANTQAARHRTARHPEGGGAVVGDAPYGHSERNQPRRVIHDERDLGDHPSGSEAVAVAARGSDEQCNPDFWLRAGAPCAR